jgi:hypothetical protein
MSSQLELFNEELKQFFLHFAREIVDKTDAFLFHLDQEDDVYKLFVPRRILLGENTLTGQQIYEYQVLPVLDKFTDSFKTYFEKNGQRGAQVLLENAEMTDQGLYGKIRVLGTIESAPLQQQRKLSLDDFIAILGRCNTKYRKLKEDYAWTEQLLEKCMKALRERRQHQEYLQGIVRTWYRDRATPEDCVVCWQPMSPSDFAVTPCGHFLCAPCLDQCSCTQGCPVCRYGQVQEEEAAAEADDFIPLV